jgi:hypothetical protein
MNLNPFEREYNEGLNGMGMRSAGVPVDDQGPSPVPKSGTMRVTTMSQTIQLGNTGVDETRLADLCLRYHVKELSLFGSAARGQMRPDSDIDLLVECLPDSQVDLRRADAGSIEPAGA